MKSTFLLSGVFPPPAAFAFVLVGQDRFGAGFAADADKAAFVEGVVGYFVGADVHPDVGGAPVGEGVEFD